MDGAKILVVEDSADLAGLLKRGLVEEGFCVETVPSAEVAFRRLIDSWDLVILDLMLPDASGEVVLRHLSQHANRPLVLVLSARAEVRDKISLFRLGCDDYLTKPFVFEELLGRVRALMRRPLRVASADEQYEGVSLDASTHRVIRGKAQVVLTPKEFSILLRLFAEPGSVIPRAELVRSVWGQMHEPKTNFIDVHLANLRRKLEHVDCDGWLQTVRASGIAFSRTPVSGP